jgi:hypothetical protein
MNKLRSTPRRTALTIGAATLLVPAGLFSGVLVANATTGPVASNSIEEIRAIAPVLADAANPSDKLPEFLVTGPQRLDVKDNSARFMSESDGTKYWMATSPLNEACLISLQPGPDQFASMTCGSSDDVARHGLALQVEDESGSERAYFVPDSYIIEPGQDLTQAADQLWVGPADEPAADIEVVPVTPESNKGSVELLDFEAATDE